MSSYSSLYDDIQSKDKSLLIDALIEKGKFHIAHKNVAMARQFFEYASRLGHAGATTALAQTFDKEVLSWLQVDGKMDDDAKAKKYYEKAASMGSETAKKKLNQIFSEK